MSFNRNHCLICQKRKSNSEVLSTLGDAGKTQIISSAELRKEASDLVYSQAIERILKILNTDDSFHEEQYFYHRSCYAIFTNKTKIAALAKESKYEAVQPISNSSLRTRSKIPRTNWEKCIICQKDKKEHLRLVMSENMNATMFRLAKFDYDLHVRTSAVVGDLIAEEAKYHSSCIIQAERRQKKLEDQSKDQDFIKILPFNQLCIELRNAATMQKVRGFQH